MKADYDSPWKDILETYFQSAMELCFPQIARQIDWAKGVQLLSKEFQNWNVNLTANTPNTKTQKI